VKIYVLGKISSITYWLEDTVDAFRADGHEVRVGVTRHPWLNAALEGALHAPIAARIGRGIRQFAPDFILGIGAYHISPSILEAIADRNRPPPLVGWVGDDFADTPELVTDLFDLVGYTDSGLLARHQDLGFTAPAFYLPHAVNQRRAPTRAPAHRAARMVLVANPTPHRRQVVDAIAAPVVIYGRAWSTRPGTAHDIHAQRVRPRDLMDIYEGNLAALNIRNEYNVLNGLNQRNFDPYLVATPVVTDDQPDLQRCFEPGQEVLVYRGADDLNDIYERLRRAPRDAARVGENGRRRVLAEHTYGHRLAAITSRL
jgi:spore maturation protein CgeB